MAVIGGGIAGLTLALQLRRSRPDTTIVVLERQDHPVPETTHKVGESTVEIAGYYLREVLGLRQHLEDEQLKKFGLRMFFSNGRNDDIAGRVELGHSVRPPGAVGTYQLDRGRLENALGDVLLDNDVTFVSGARVHQVELATDDGLHLIRVGTKDGDLSTISARWVVDATGRACLLKRRLGLGKRVGHHANAAWFRIGHPIDIDDWSDDPQWRRRIEEGRRELSTNHLMGEGYWVWLIRLASGSISIGVVADPAVHPFASFNTFERAMRWLNEHEPQCAAIIEQHRDKLQDFRVMRDYAYSCEQVFSPQRWCLAGEAGVFLDPLYSPGLDLIAISNGLITDLVSRSLDGEDVAELAAIHNRVFLLIAEGWLQIYEQQYPLMGKARVMLVKVIWDTAVYWAVPGLLFFQDQIRQLADNPEIVVGLARFSVASKQVQRFLREWGALDSTTELDPFIRFYDFDFMPRLHVGMTADLDATGFAAQFAANIRFIEQLSGQLIAEITAEFEASGDAAKQLRAQQWRSDPELAALVAVHEHDRHLRLISTRWISLRSDRQLAGTTREGA
ncbi:NAD(P)/FAD-dependent oxidoreductase [Nocardia sp. NPDC051321]|uniref:NAD(P)/FAD-dependent oxidoreductase n=1 Tax=Nocardia sp. NPDC051321 TaxID=3364323 RepID=UPI00378BAFF8